MKVLGGVKRGFANGSLSQAELAAPRAVCADPLTPTIYSWAIHPGTVRVMASVGGGSKGGESEGRNRFGGEISRRLWSGRTQSRAVLFATDYYSNAIHRIDLTTAAPVVTTVATEPDAVESADGSFTGTQLNDPIRLCFDRSADVKPDTVLYISATSGLYRFDTDKPGARLQRIPLTSNIPPFAVVVLKRVRSLRLIRCRVNQCRWRVVAVTKVNCEKRVRDLRTDRVERRCFRQLLIWWWSKPVPVPVMRCNEASSLLTGPIIESVLHFPINCFNRRYL